MLKRFEVMGFRGFKKRIIFDLSAGSYEFNPSVIKGDFIKNAIIYGKNGSGKSALSIALFDAVFHLTDCRKMKPTYVYPYCNLDSQTDRAEFKYTLVLNGHELEYVYHKRNIDYLIDEELMVDGERVLHYNYEAASASYFNPKYLANLQINLPDNKLSVLKYIKNNTPTGSVQPIHDLVGFFEGMLWYRSLIDGNDFVGFKSQSELIDEVIYRSGKVDEFAAFLRDNGIDYRLSFVENEGSHQLMVKFGESPAVPFASVASTGTKTLELFFAWKVDAFQKITFLLIDEFDAFFHFETSGMIVRALNGISSFQTVLTTHNTNLMDNSLTRPDCCFIISSSGELVPICKATDRVLREGHNLAKMYVKGKFQNI